MPASDTLFGRLRRAIDASTGTRSDRNKLIAVSVVLGAVLIWLAIYIAPSLKPRTRAEVPDTPGWRLVNKINQSLSEKPEFADTMVDLTSESPLKLRVFGAVHSPEELKELEEFVRANATNAEVTNEVRLMDELSEPGDS